MSAQRRKFKLPAALIVCLFGEVFLSALHARALAGELTTGAFSFSDELGGFRLLSASGTGTRSDPIVLVEEVDEAMPITLVIRRRAPEPGEARPGFAPLTIVKVVINRSRRIWAGFELELQEILGKPSGYGDGLSFNQVGSRPPDVTSDAFSDHNRLFEPYDRIRFENGYVDPEATARFKFTVTDPTPVAEFFLVQDPKLLSATLPAQGTVAESAPARPGDARAASARLRRAECPSPS